MDKRMRVLAALATTDRELLRKREDRLPRVSYAFLQEMWVAGLIDGAGYPDERGVGTRKQTRVWWITEKGRGVLREREQIASLSEEEINHAAKIVQIQMQMHFGRRIEDEAELRESAEKLALARREYRKGKPTASSPLPRVIGHVPEIVVTPTPAPSKPEERE